MLRRVLISDWKTFQAWDESGKALESDLILTESPGVFEALHFERKVIDVSAALDLHESNDLCSRVADLALKWRYTLDALLDDLLPGTETGRILSRDLANVMVCLVYHRVLLEHALTDGELLVPYLDEPGNNLDRMDTNIICPLGVNYFGLAAQAGIPGVKAIPLRFTSTDQGSGRDHISFGYLFLLFLLKLSAASPGFIYRYLLNFWGRISQIGIVQKRLSAHVFIYKLNDLLQSEALSLVPRGCSLSRVKPIKVLGAVPYKVSLQEPLLDVTPNNLRDALRPAAYKIECLVNDILFPSIQPMQEMVKAEIAKYCKGRRSLLLSGSVVSPLEVLMSRCFAENGVASVQFQHGGIGLIDMYQKTQFFSDMAVCDGFVCFNSHERDFYQQLSGDNKVSFFVKGTHHEHRGVLSSVARWAGRRVFSVNKDTKLVIYAPTRFKDGQVFANDVFDMKYWNWMKILLKEAASGANCRFVVKVHQKGLWEYGASEYYRNRKNPLEGVSLGENVEIRKYPQLNYCRFGADLLIIDRATSTIGWAIAADVPFLYLEMPFCRLLPDVRDKLKKAIFYVDGAKDGWVENLRKLLDMETKVQRRLWDNMFEEREEFIEKYVLGPIEKQHGLYDWLWKVSPIRTE